MSKIMSLDLCPMRGPMLQAHRCGESWGGEDGADGASKCSTDWRRHGVLTGRVTKQLISKVQRKSELPA